MEDIQALKNKLFNKFGIALKEDDPAWLMILIYKELMQEVNNAINDLENIPKITTKNEEILKALNAVQIEVNSTIDKSNNLVNSLETKSEVLIDAFQGEISKIKTTIDKSIAQAINNIEIDTTELSKIIDKKVEGFDFKKIDDLVNTTNNKTEQMIDEFVNKSFQMEKIDKLIAGAIQELNANATTLKQKTDTVNNTIKEVKKINQKVSNLKLLFVLLVGLIGGFTVATYFKIDALSDYYFAGYDEKQKVLEMEQVDLKSKMNQLSEFQKFMLNTKSKVRFGTFRNTTVKYIEITNAYDYGTEYTFTRDASEFVGIK